MKKIMSSVILSILFLCISSPSYALDFIKFGTSHDDAFWGAANYDGLGLPSAVQYLQARDKNQINPLNTLDVSDQNVQDALNGNFGEFDALLFSEQIEPLSGDTYELINNYVSNGGCVITTGSHDDGFGLEGPFLNNSFGYNINAPEINDLEVFTIQPDAAGTPFQGGPVSLLSGNASEAYSNTPGKTIYSGSEGVIVFADEFGLGHVIAIGWDYCCTPPEESGPIEDWFEVINRAFEICQPIPPSQVPTLSEWGLIAMAGILGIVGFMVIRRRQVSV